MKNNCKYQSYRFAMHLLEHARIHKDLPMCIAAVTVAESLIADRCQSYLYFKERAFMENREKEKRYISTKEMLEKCGKHFKNLNLSILSRSGKPILTKDLFVECTQWLKLRNDILHGFAKSKPESSTINIVDYLHNAIDAAEAGLRLVKLVNKWHKQQLNINKKN